MKSDCKKCTYVPSLFIVCVYIKKDQRATSGFTQAGVQSRLTQSR